MNDLVGFRFRPTDEEIILYFLAKKMGGYAFPVHAINEVDILKYDPWKLPELSAIADDQVWYFFKAPSYKSPNNRRTDRTVSTRTGNWKVTGRDREVKDKHTGDVIGIKKTLVFRSPNTVRTNWVMHEYHSNDAPSYQKEFVLCRLKRKFNDKSEILPDELGSYWPPNPGNNGVQNIISLDWPLSSRNNGVQIMGSQVNDELPMELESLDSELDEEDFAQLHLLMHPVEEPSPSNGSINGSNVWSSQLDMSEPEDDFVNSILADEVDLVEESMHTRPHGFNPTESLTGVYFEDGSDSESETVQAQFCLGTPKLFNGSTSSREYHDRNKKGENGLFHDEMLPSVVKSETNAPKTISLVLSSSPNNTRPCKTHLPNSHFIEKERAHEKLKFRGQISRESASGDGVNGVAEHAINLAKKEKSVVKFGEDQKMAQTTHAKTNSKSRSNGSHGSNRKDSFIFLETSALNHKQNPPLLYLRNAAVGVFLLVFCFWEMASLH